MWQCDSHLSCNQVHASPLYSNIIPLERADIQDLETYQGSANEFHKRSDHQYFLNFKNSQFVFHLFNFDMGAKKNHMQ